MPYSYSKLRGRIVEKFGSQEKFSENIGISRVSISKKLNGITGFSQLDIEKWALALDIKVDEYSSYFFT
nr:MAG TPA: Protein of unknown function (DUF739) [Caudoviricetes sp.]